MITFLSIERITPTMWLILTSAFICVVIEFVMLYLWWIDRGTS